MLTRRHLRIKVMQAVYAHLSVEGQSLGQGEKKMVQSFQQLFDLFIYQLSFLIEVFDFAELKIEEGKNKLLPTREDLDPNVLFIENRLIAKLRQNRDIKKHTERLRINWSDHQEIVRKVFQEIKGGAIYQNFMAKKKSSFKEDRTLLLQLIKEYVADSEDLQYHYEEQNIFWDEDYFAANRLLINSIEGMMPDDDELTPLPGVFKDLDEDGKSEDRQFAIDLFRKTVLKGADFDDMIAGRAKNWEFERIAKVDIILIKMALVELLYFPSIPIKVTINEYVEISKYYSTPKSRIFINGILDNLVHEWMNEGKIQKIGRGLKEN
ncbi:MAG: transcription antitermination factor NusB [Bacteroidales bacterium]